MSTVPFTPNLTRHLDTPDVEVGTGTVLEDLEKCFVQNLRLRSYLLDDQGRLRKHVAVFVGREIITDRTRLSEEVAAGG